MKYQNLKLRQMLAAEYVLGTLRGRGRRRFERLLKNDGALRTVVHAWEARLAELNHGITPVTPREVVWASLAHQINAPRKVTPIRAAAAPAPRADLWRGWAVLSTAASVILGFGLWQQMQKPPQIITKTETVRVEVPVQEPLPYVAMLQPAKSEAKWKISLYPEKGLIKVVTDGHYVIDENAKSLELWIVAKDGPHSLGLLPTQGNGEMPMPKDMKVAGDLTLAISLEPRGGSPTGKPTGPVLLAAPAIRPA
jgi:anti-sigma-K factor RskA